MFYEILVACDDSLWTSYFAGHPTHGERLPGPPRWAQRVVDSVLGIEPTRTTGRACHENR